MDWGITFDMKNHTRLLVFSGILPVFMASILSVSGVQAPEATEAAPQVNPADQLIDSEIEFAASLVRWGFPDYAEKVMTRLLVDHPEAKARAASIKIQSLTARGKFDEAEKLIKEMPPDSIETLSMTLALGDAYYAWNKLGNAKQCYESFFKKYPNGPPKEVAKLYSESAYKYAQMLALKGDNKGALEAYRYVLMGQPDADIERQVKTEMAEFLLKVGTSSPPAERKALFEEATKLCTDIQWKGTDLFFGKSVVIMAHMKLVDGDPTGAVKVIDGYMDMLQQIDVNLKQEKISLKFSPMAECRFLLATIAEDEGRAMIDDPAKLPEAKKRLSTALTHYYTIFGKYPMSSWAPESGKRAEALVAFLEAKLGTKIPRPNVDRKSMREAQIKDAKQLFSDNNFKDAAEKYLELLNLFPEESVSLSALTDLATCYINEQDDLYAQMVTGYLAERFGRNPTLSKEAGDALLRIAGVYEGAGNMARVNQIYQDFIKYFPTHEKVSFIIFRFGDFKVREEKYGEALDYFKQMIVKYPKARQYPDALSRAALCETKLGAYSNAVGYLIQYAAELSPGAEKVSATFRIGDTYRLSEQYVPAINEYGRVVKYCTEEASLYSPTAEDVTRNRKLQELALYFKAVCYTRLKKPEDKLPLFQTKAIEGFDSLLKDFPKSEMAPMALSVMGTLLYIQNKPDAANQAYERLKRDFPTSDQASNIVFAQGDSLLKLGKPEEAIKVFGQMFNNPKGFTPYQFMKVAVTMGEAKQYETAIKAYEQVRTTTDSNLWQVATLGMCESYAAVSNYAATIQPLEDVIAKFPKSKSILNAYFLLSRAYADKAAKESDPERKQIEFNNAIKASNKAKKLMDPDMRPRTEIDIAAIQILQGKKDDAIASYSRLLLMGDPNKAVQRPFIEKAFEGLVPLLLEKKETASFQEVIDYCAFYLKYFPTGTYVEDARKWRGQMQMKGFKPTGGSEEEATDGAAPAGGAATPAPAVVAPAPSASEKAVPAVPAPATPPAPAAP